MVVVRRAFSHKGNLTKSSIHTIIYTDLTAASKMSAENHLYSMLRDEITISGDF